MPAAGAQLPVLRPERGLRPTSARASVAAHPRHPSVASARSPSPASAFDKGAKFAARRKLSGGFANRPSYAGWRSGGATARRSRDEDDNMRTSAAAGLLLLGLFGTAQASDGTEAARWRTEAAARHHHPRRLGRGPRPRPNRRRRGIRRDLRAGRGRLRPHRVQLPSTRSAAGRKPMERRRSGATCASACSWTHRR